MFEFTKCGRGRRDYVSQIGLARGIDITSMLQEFLQSRLGDSSASRDPFELDRLAEELDTRERAHAGQGASAGPQDDISSGRDLPTYIPLSHDNPYLTADTFDIENFLLSRSFTSLPDLRTELRDYLSTLKEELVTLINDDYEAFITLSTDLRGEGIRLDRMKRPLQSLKAQMLVCLCRS